MNHLYIISGKANTGKTHTCWLLYTMLSCLGEVKLFENLGFPNAAIPYSFVLGHLQRKMLHPRTRSFRDFRAIIELKGKRIALFSAGDQLENNHNDILSLLKNEQWAHDNSADYIICAARERNYEHRGWTQSGTPHSLHYIELPILMHLHFGSPFCQWFFNLGPQIGYCVKDESSTITHPFDWGLAAGTGVLFNTKKAGTYHLEIRYDFSLGGVLGTTVTDKHNMANPMDLSVNLGWVMPVRQRRK